MIPVLLQTLAHQIADGFLLVCIDQRDQESIDVGRVKLGLGAASRVLLCLELPDDRLEDHRHVGGVDTGAQTEDIDVVARHGRRIAQIGVGPTDVGTRGIDQQIVPLDMRLGSGGE